MVLAVYSDDNVGNGIPPWMPRRIVLPLTATEIDRRFAKL